MTEMTEMTDLVTIGFNPDTRRARIVPPGEQLADGEHADVWEPVENIEAVLKRVYGWSHENQFVDYRVLTHHTSMPSEIGLAWWITNFDETKKNGIPRVKDWRWSVYWQHPASNAVGDRYVEWMSEAFGPPPELDDPHDVRRDDLWSINGTVDPSTGFAAMFWAFEVVATVWKPEFRATVTGRHPDGWGCPNCGSLRFGGEVHVEAPSRFAGHQCHDCWYIWQPPRTLIDSTPDRNGNPV